MKSRLELGDVFSMPLDRSRAGIGQVVATYGQGAFYFAIFDLLVHPDAVEASIDTALAAAVLFLAPSLDSRLPVPYLTVVGSRPVRPGLPLPAHREIDADNLVQVVDYSGRRRRPATDEEARRLQNRRFIAPLRLARALRATAGMEPWQDSYASLVPDDELTAERLFGPEGVPDNPQGSPWSPRDPQPRTGAIPQILTSRALTPRNPRLSPPVAPTTGAQPVVPATAQPVVVAATGAQPVVVAATGAQPVVAAARARRAAPSTGAGPVVPATGAQPVVAATGAQPAVLVTGAQPVVAATGAHSVVPATGAQPVVAVTGAQPVV
ncbi:MAG: hypothetical protein FWD11_03000, partial [Micrococcales bacterium]|nr:hypothetical protein [Micrococcales bacterium]